LRSCITQSVRKQAGWFGVVLVLALASMIVISGMYELSWNRNRTLSGRSVITVGIASGGLQYREELFSGEFESMGWRLYKRHPDLPRWEWVPRYEDNKPSRLRSIRLFIPFWIPLLVFAVFTVRFFVRKNRPKSECCQTCGYSRVGISASAACPECGQKPESQQKQA